MIILKTEKEINKIHESCQILKNVMEKALLACQEGVSTFEIDSLIKTEILKRGAKPSFLGFEGYKYSSCLSINDEVVHGLPGKRKLALGDVLKVDIGAFKDGWHSDMARTIVIGLPKLPVEKQKELKHFLEIGQKSLDSAIEKAKLGGTVGDISFAMQSVVEQAGFNVIRDLVGHGLGRSLHEDPNVPCYGGKNTGIPLQEGMVLAIEVMYVMGKFRLFVKSDNWTFKTFDRSLAGMFEDTVAITKNGPRVLTR